RSRLESRWFPDSLTDHRILRLAQSVVIPSRHLAAIGSTAQTLCSFRPSIRGEARQGTAVGPAAVRTVFGNPRGISDVFERHCRTAHETLWLHLRASPAKRLENRLRCFFRRFRPRIPAETCPRSLGL